MKVKEIFQSINGEVGEQGQGTWTTFVRFAGCSAGCSFCDTKESWSTKNIKEQSPKDVYNKIKKITWDKALKNKRGLFYIKNILLTGGEPLEQEPTELLMLLNLLLNDKKIKYNVSLETNGLHKFDFIKRLFPEVSLIVDYKPVSTGILRNEQALKDLEFLKYGKDFLKVLTANQQDTKEALSTLLTRGFYSEEAFINDPRIIYFSPVLSTNAEENNEVISNLINDMKAFGNCDSLGIGLNIQIHKLCGIK